ncbi:MFS-type transporter SLC18B1-like [Gigantopelta aegis]|uniref:MFS-type transporter SLC18B1-like n=1 Tax=Gigantopelta aegis TaxID=1735272 RepID=UPI001B88B809|nr:MFS-type transporter SLC18B1-like [Gigantopelta aegis]
MESETDERSRFVPSKRACVVNAKRSCVVHDGRSNDDDTDLHAVLSNSLNTTDAQTDGFSFRRLPRRQKFLLYSICITRLLTVMNEALLGPIFPEEASRRGIDSQVVGWVFAAYAFGQVIISPMIGKFLMQIGLKFTYLSGIFVIGVCTSLFGLLALSPADGKMSASFVALCFIIQIFLSVGLTAVDTAAIAVVSNEFQSNFTSVFSLTEVCVGLGLSIAPGIGGFFYMLGGFVLPFVVCGSLILLSLPINYLLVLNLTDKPVRKDSITDVIKKKTSSWRILRHPSVIITCVSVALAAGSWTVLDPILEPELSEYGLTPEMAGLAFLLLSASYSLGCPFSGWFAAKLSDSRILMIAGLLTIAISHLLLGPCPLLDIPTESGELWLKIVSLVVLGVSISITVIPTYGILMELALEYGVQANDEVHGAVAGLWCSAYALGDFFAPMYGGWVVGVSDFGAGLSYYSIVVLIVALLLTMDTIARHKCKTHRQSDEERPSETEPSLKYSEDETLGGWTFRDFYRIFLTPTTQIE